MHIKYVLVYFFVLLSFRNITFIPFTIDVFWNIFKIRFSNFFPISIGITGEKHILRLGQHPHFQHHRSSVCRAMVPRHSAQRPGQRWRCGRGQNHQRLSAAQVALPDDEHLTDGALQRVRRVRHQQLPNVVCRPGAAVEREEQRRSGVCAGAHSAEHGKGKGMFHKKAIP